MSAVDFEGERAKDCEVRSTVVLPSRGLEASDSCESSFIYIWNSYCFNYKLKEAIHGRLLQCDGERARGLLSGTAPR